MSRLSYRDVDRMGDRFLDPPDPGPEPCCDVCGLEGELNDGLCADCEAAETEI